MEKRELTCIGCPMGCPLTVELENGAVTAVYGNTCPRGDAYARKEVTAPTRIVTTTVRVTGGVLAAVSCKTQTDIPKDKIFAVVRALKAVTVAAPVTIGQVVLPNAAATRLVMTMNARELMHFFSLRCCNRAQWEIREMAWQMLALCKQAAPALFEHAGPACVSGVCPEGKNTCGKAAEVREKAGNL